MFAKHAEEKKLTLVQPAVHAPAGAGMDAPSVISADLAIKGGLRTERDLRLEGRIDGDVRVSRLVICEGATVKGNIHAKEVIVRGRVEGSIHAGQVQLTPTAHVTGDIFHDRQLAIEDGAFFVGTCRRTGQAGRPARHLVAVAAE